MTNSPGTLFKCFKAKRRQQPITPVEPPPETREGKFVFELLHALFAYHEKSHYPVSQER